MGFFEYWSLRYMDFVQNEFYSYLLIVFGALIGYFFKSVNFKLQRGTYFFYTSIVVLCAGLSQLIWFNANAAIANGQLLPIVAADIFAWAATGWFSVILGKARALDAYGNTRSGFLALIPIGNLWLLFTNSKFKFDRKDEALVSGTMAVILGIVVGALANGVSVATLIKIEENVANLSSQTVEDVNRKYFQYDIQKYGLEQALVNQAAYEVTGVQIDSITFFRSIDVEGATMRYNFDITDSEVTSLNPDWQVNLQVDNCLRLKPLIDEGANIEFVYTSAASGLLAHIASNRQSCG